jgi:hypothetical protein
MNKIKMFDVTKVTIQDIIKSNFNMTIHKEDIHRHTIKQQDTPLFRQLSLIRGYETTKIDELIFVEAKHNKKRKEQLTRLLAEGFTFNNRHFVRFGKSSSQAKDGITVFIESSIYKEMLERSQLGVKIDKCVVSKYESYRCLIFSACQTITEKLPYIIIVDEYKKIIPDQCVRYAVKKDIEYIDKDTNQKKVYKNQRFIEEGIKDIEISPFDGFGVHTKEVSEMLGKYISNKYIPILYQIRLPFMKGVTVEAPFKEYYRSIGVTKIKDVFGNWHDIEKIDCIWNVSMWKGFSIFKKEFGNSAWNEYLSRIDKYQYKLGISKYSHHTDDINFYSRMNFQYLQCLDLTNQKYVQQFKDKKHKFNILDQKNWGKIIKLAKYSTDLFEKIIKGDKLYTLKFLGITDSEFNSVNSKYIEAILINDSMLKDPCIKSMLKRKLDKAINQMKYGKIYADGFYHTVVGDIIGYLEFCAGKEVKGCLNAGEFYAATLPLGECLSFRSPLVDPSEVNKINLAANDEIKKYFMHFENQDVCMINMYDLTMQQQGGMDEDGDAVFLCKDKSLISSKIDRPIVVDIEDKKSSDPVKYNSANIIEYELNSRDNRIGEITNIATSILNQFTDDPKWKKRNEDNVSLLRLYQGKEIDYVKTGFRWIITKNLRKYLKKLPYFLLYNYPKKLNVYNRIRDINKKNNVEDRIPYNAFHSPSPMNELCEYICQWEKHSINWDRTVKNNGHLLLDSQYDLTNKHIIKTIKRIYDEFKKELPIVLNEEVNFEIFMEKYKKMIEEIKLPREHLANYCIYVAYRSISEEKVLCWSIYGDIMLDNLRKNSSDKAEYVIVETDTNDEDSQEFLGKYYKLMVKQKGGGL